MAEKAGKVSLVFHDIARFRSQIFDRLLKPHGLTTSQAWVLAFLFREDGLTQSELAKRLEVGTVTVGGLVDRLEARGLVSRHADPNDRRANRVCLTDEAHDLIGLMNKYSRTVDDIAFQGMPPETIDMVNAHLKSVRENLLAALNEEKASA